MVLFLYQNFTWRILPKSYKCKKINFPKNIPKYIIHIYRPQRGLFLLQNIDVGVGKIFPIRIDPT